MTNRQFFLHHSAMEFPKFVAAIRAVPGDQSAYRPHPRSRSAHELVAHLIGHEQDLLELARTGKINHRIEVPFKNIDEAIAKYEEAHEAAHKALSAMDEATWESQGQFLIDGVVRYEYPRRDLAWMLFLDSVHHRGQLTAYLRPMGAKVPSIYGPSADTMVAAT